MRIALRMLLFVAVLLGVPLGAAGRWDLPMVWAYLGVYLAAMLTAIALIDRDLVKERMHPAPGGKDRHLRVIVKPFFLAYLLVAGLDLRFGWSSLPLSVQIVGLAWLAASLAFVIWTMRVNRFFSPVVRIQEERGHHLVTARPYAWIRHPGYLASLMMLPSGGLALGSLWSLAPLAPVVFLLVRRVVVEDRFLRENLDGYVDYAQRVRYRLLPGVW